MHPLTLLGEANEDEEDFELLLILLTGFCDAGGGESCSMFCSQEVATRVLFGKGVYMTPKIVAMTITILAWRVALVLGADRDALLSRVPEARSLGRWCCNIKEPAAWLAR